MAILCLLWLWAQDQKYIFFGFWALRKRSGILWNSTFACSRFLFYTFWAIFCGSFCVFIFYKISFPCLQTAFTTTYCKKSRIPYQTIYKMLTLNYCIQPRMILALLFRILYNWMPKPLFEISLPSNKNGMDTITKSTDKNDKNRYLISRKTNYYRFYAISLNILGLVLDFQIQNFCSCN